MHDVLFPAAGLLIFLLGWPLARRRVPPNSWYGLRVRATMSDDRVWYDANAVAGRDSMVFGAGFTVIALALPLLGVSGDTYAAICVGLLGIGTVTLLIRGLQLANRLARERQHR